MRIVTWNINSIRIRFDLLQRLVDQHNPDVICFQETKVKNENFPREFPEKLGYPHYTINGIPSYNGTAIFSKLPFQNHGYDQWVGKDDGRHLYVHFDSGLEIHNYYIPAGGDIPDPNENPKFDHKLKFLQETTSYWQEQSSKSRKAIILGDFNIAPLENDVWSHKQLLDVVSHTPIEVEHLSALQNSFEWHDAIRHFVPDNEKLYSWWSYRARDWEKSNRGRRLDHIWVSQELKDKLIKGFVVSEARGWEKPSDHVPVILDVDV